MLAIQKPTLDLRIAHGFHHRLHEQGLEGFADLVHCRLLAVLPSLIQGKRT